MAAAAAAAMTRKSDCTSFCVVNVDSLFASCSSSSMLSVVLSAVTLRLLGVGGNSDKASGFDYTGAILFDRNHCENGKKRRHLKSNHLCTRVRDAFRGARYL